MPPDATRQMPFTPVVMNMGFIRRSDVHPAVRYKVLVIHFGSDVIDAFKIIPTIVISHTVPKTDHPTGFLAITRHTGVMDPAIRIKTAE